MQSVSKYSSIQKLCELNQLPVRPKGIPVHIYLYMQDEMKMETEYDVQLNTRPGIKLKMKKKSETKDANSNSTQATLNNKNIMSANWRDDSSWCCLLTIVRKCISSKTIEFKYEKIYLNI